MVKWIKKRARLLAQIGFTAITNGYFPGFARGTIYKGNAKAICVPGLNCYSCPGALGSCPIGALQATLGDRNYHFAFYVVGFLLVVGAVLGRFVCGWLCPFGLVQDLLAKIPFPKKKLRRLPGDALLRFLKYGILLAFVFILPMFAVNIVGQGSPWFCQYICPSGTLMAGLPLVALNESLRGAAGFLYTWKVGILCVLIALSLIVYRPFCRYICPLGAIYGLFNPIAFYRIRIDEEKCTHCGACSRACPMNVPVEHSPNSPECIRCGACREACKPGALSMGFACAKREKARAEQGAQAK